MNARHRAILFVDGSNWYHGCKRLGVREPGRIDFARVALKLVGPRLWVETRYYVGQVPEHGRRELSRRQHGFTARQKTMDQRFTVHFGRIAHGIFHGLSEIASRHEISEFMVEKAVDVHLAMALVLMAERDEFDTAYLSPRNEPTPPTCAGASSRLQNDMPRGMSFRHRLAPAQVGSIVAAQLNRIGASQLGSSPRRPARGPVHVVPGRVRPPDLRRRKSLPR